MMLNIILLQIWYDLYWIFHVSCIPIYPDEKVLNLHTLHYSLHYNRLYDDVANRSILLYSPSSLSYSSVSTPSATTSLADFYIKVEYIMVEYIHNIHNGGIHNYGIHNGVFVTLTPGCVPLTTGCLRCTKLRDWGFY